MESATNNESRRLPLLRRRPLVIVIVAALIITLSLAVYLLFMSERTKTYSDNLLSFNYPSRWTVTQKRDYNSLAGQAMSIKSDSMPGKLANGTETKFRLDAALFVKKKDVPVVTCIGCTVIQDRATRLKNPAGPFQAVFASDILLFKSGVVMNLNQAVLKSGTKVYSPYVILSGDRKLYIRVIIDYDDHGHMIPVNNVDSFVSSIAYNQFEKLLNTLNIKK